MIKKYFAKTSLFLIFTFVFPPFIIAEGFIENNGQFLSNVIAKKNVFGGALFIEKAKLTYCFYNQEQLLELISNNGFTNVEYRNLSNGISAIHSGWKT